ncbi:MAG: hypothetical protein ACQEP6_03150, partial [Patescibacteria group bacterium]
FKASSTKKMERFKEILESRGVKVTRRHSFGSDIKSACGQLAGGKNDIYELLDKLANLELPDTEYVIYGSGPMAIRGIREANDLDVVVTDRLFGELSQRHGNDDPDKLVLEGGDIDIYPTRNSLFDEPEKVIERAETIEGFRFALLEDIISWKEKVGREKDLVDVKTIEKYLNRSFESDQI